MRFIALTVALSAWALQPRMPEVRVDSSAAGVTIHIHNPTAQPLTAVCLGTSDKPFWIDEVREPIPAGGDRAIQLDHALPIKVQAAVYADGLSVGEWKLVDQLRQRRLFTLDTARELIKALRTGQKLNTPKATVMGDLKIQADTLRVQPDREPARDLILRTITQLDTTKSYSDVLLDLLKEESNIATSKPAL